MSTDWFKVSNDVWDVFLKTNPSEDVKFEMAEALVRIDDEADYFYMWSNGYAAMEYLVEVDDEYYLRTHNLLGKTETETKGQLNFDYTHNGLSKDRAKRILEVWKRKTSDELLDAFEDD